MGGMAEHADCRCCDSTFSLNYLIWNSKQTCIPATSIDGSTTMKRLQLRTVCARRAIWKVMNNFEAAKKPPSWWEHHQQIQIASEDTRPLSPMLMVCNFRVFLYPLAVGERVALAQVIADDGWTTPDNGLIKIWGGIFPLMKQCSTLRSPHGRIINEPSKKTKSSASTRAHVQIAQSKRDIRWVSSLWKAALPSGERRHELFMISETIEQKAKINDKPLIGEIIFRLHHRRRWQYIWLLQQMISRTFPKRNQK